MVTNWAPLAEDDPLPGDPLGVAQLICHLREEALAITDITVQLAGIDSGTLWTGDAATAFRQRQERLKPDLDLVGRRVYGTIQALDAFGRALQDVQSQGRRALADALEAEDRIKRARLGLDAMSRQEIAPGEPATSGPLARPAPGPVWGPNWQGQIDEAEAQMAAARRLFADACEIYQNAEHRCEKQLEEAAHDDLTDPKRRGFFGTVGHAFANIADHFTDLEKFSELLGATSAVCGMAALFPPLAFLEPVALAATGLKLLVDMDLAATHRPGHGWGEVGKDALGLGLFAFGRIATAGARGSVAATATEDLAEVRRAGELGKLDDYEHAIRGGKTLTGRTGARIVGKQSRKLLREFHGEQFSGKLPPWQRSMNAMRHLEIELPSAQQLSISRRAVRWARRAKAAEFLAGVGDEHEIANTLRESGASHSSEHAGRQ